MLRNEIALAVALAGVSPVHAESPLAPGVWHFTITFSSPSVYPEKKLAEFTSERCITAAFVATDPYLQPKRDSATVGEVTCRPMDYKREGNNASWRLVCNSGNGNASESNFKSSVTETTINTVLTQEKLRSDGSREIEQVKMVGKHVDSTCPAGVRQAQ